MSLASVVARAERECPHCGAIPAGPHMTPAEVRIKHLEWCPRHVGD